MTKYSRLLPICHGFSALHVAYYLKWHDKAGKSFCSSEFKSFAACFDSRTACKYRAEVCNGINWIDHPTNRLHGNGCGSPAMP
jgi:hypothetical protein